MHVEDIRIPGSTTLAAKLYVPKAEGPFPAILLCHGFASCKEEYMALPHALCQKGFAVLTFDFSGHGESTGPRGYVSEHSHLDDTLRAYQTLIDRPEIDLNRTALVGHSLGTAAVLRFLATKVSKHVQAAVLLAPMHQTKQSVSPIEQQAYYLLSQAAKPWLKLTGRHSYIPYKVTAKDIYTSKEAIARAKTQKLLMKSISVHNYTYLVEKQDNVLYGQKVNTPTLVIAAEKDSLIPTVYSKTVFDALASNDKEFHIIMGSGHSLLGDRQAKEVTSMISDWLCKHLQLAQGTALTQEA
jgi:alpha-beta hydrolase superfamily lysophospholipase